MDLEAFVKNLSAQVSKGEPIDMSKEVEAFGQGINAGIAKHVDDLCIGKDGNDDIECPCGKTFKVKNKKRHIASKHHINECCY